MQVPCHGSGSRINSWLGREFAVLPLFGASLWCTPPETCADLVRSAQDGLSLAIPIIRSWSKVEKQICRVHISKMTQTFSVVEADMPLGAGQPPRFYCDEMLGHLARFLRTAGFDTRLACDGAADREILREAVAESRWLLTLDRCIMEHKQAQGVAILLQQGSLDDHVEFLATHFDLDWLEQSFTRCLIDNTLLVEASAAHYARVPEASQKLALKAAKHCPECGRIYWRGSHFQRMRRRLVGWQERRSAEF
jgi:uncharacterized protein